MTIQQAQDSDSTGAEKSNEQACLLFEDAYFTGEGQPDESGVIRWSQSEEPEFSYGPSLAGFVWIKAFVTYVDAVETEEGICYQYRINKKFEDTEDEAFSYLADYYFDEDGNFLRVVYQINPNQDNAYTVTESIVSLDPDVVSGEIEKEYRNALDQAS